MNYCQEKISKIRKISGLKKCLADIVSSWCLCALVANFLGEYGHSKFNH